MTECRCAVNDPVIIHVVNGPHLRGAELFAVQLASALADVGVPQHLVFLKGLEADLPKTLEVTSAVRAPGLSFFAARQWLRNSLTADEGNIVICHGQGPQKEVLSAVMFSGRHRPFIAVKQIGMIMPWLTRLVMLRKFLIQMLFRMTDLCVCLGPKQADELRTVFGVPNGKISTIPNGRCVPDELIADATHDRNEILVVGALAAEKNPHLSLDLFAETHLHCPDMVLTFLGDGPMRTELKERAARDFPAGSVRFEGQVSNVWPFYARAGILLLCSQTEGVPGVVIEASYAGVPTVAWDVGDIATVLENGTNGLLTPFEDPKALATALVSVVLDEDTRQKLAAGALRISPRFHIHQIAAAYKKILPL